MPTIFIPLSQSVADKIAEMIFLEKRFAPGSKIPNELQLAEELSVSRTAIREGVMALIAKGILEIKRGKGTFVKARPAGTDDPLGLSLLEDKRMLVRNWLEFRLILEPESVRLAAMRASKEELDIIEEYEQTGTQRIRDDLNFDESDALFHTAIAKASHNEVIEHMIPSLRHFVSEALTTSRYRHVGAANPAAENVLIYHREIVRCLRRRDGEGASIAMRYHIKRVMTDLGM